ncbi:MAG: NAD-dependent epimerase/dehydratase family protein [Nitrospirota bacterium]
MKILIVGATGQIGSALVDALSNTRHQITVLVRHKHNLPLLANIVVIPHVEFTPAAFDAALTGMDHIIYCLGLPEQYMQDNSVFERVNYGLLKTFLDSLRRSSVRSLTYVSTYEVFQDIDGIISETDRIADESKMTPYFSAMTRAYRLATVYAKENNIGLTTIHPAAVYGGLNTGDGFTGYMDNLLHRRFWKVPFIVNGRFPVVHAGSLADAIIRSLEVSQGAYIVSDQMTSLREIALTVNKYARSYVPVTMPLWVARIGVSIAEKVARLFSQRPIMAKVQLKFITSGMEPRADKVRKETGWSPLSLDEGIKIYLSRPPDRHGK